MNIDSGALIESIFAAAAVAGAGWIVWKVFNLLNTWLDANIFKIKSNANLVVADERGNLPVARGLLESGALVQEALGLINPQLIRADQNGLLPISQSLLTSNVAAEQILALLASHIMNGRPMANVPHSVSYAPHMIYKNDINAIGQDVPPQLASLPARDFWQLYSAGMLPTAGFLMGHDLTDGQPVTADWKQLYSALIGGQSGSGKSTLIRNVLAQSALQGGRFVVLDKHFGAGDESLGSSLMPLRPLMLCDVAASDKQMRDALQFVADIGQRRLSGQDKDKSPLILVVDEATALLSRSAVADELTNVLGTISQETRKVGVYAMCIGQQFSGKILDTEVRNSFVSMVSCKARREVARVMSGNNEFGKSAESLTIGQAVWMKPDGTVINFAVPNTTQQHIDQVARRVCAQNSPKTDRALLPSTRDDSLPDDDDSLDLEGNGKASGRQREGDAEGDAVSMRIVDLFLSGTDPQQIVQQVFSVDSNGGRKYIEKRNYVFEVMREFWKSDRGAL